MYYVYMGTVGLSCQLEYFMDGTNFTPCRGARRSLGQARHIVPDPPPPAVHAAGLVARVLMTSSDLRTAQEILDSLQDCLDWNEMLPRWKRNAARWLKKLESLKRISEVPVLWSLTTELHDSIKPTNFMPGWFSSEGTKPPRVHLWMETNPNDVQAVLQAIRSLRGNQIIVADGNLFSRDGMHTGDGMHTNSPACGVATTDGMHTLEAPAGIQVTKALQQVAQCKTHPRCLLEWGHPGMCILQEDPVRGRREAAPVAGQLADVSPVAFTASGGARLATHRLSKPPRTPPLVKQSHPNTSPPTSSEPPQPPQPPQPPHAPQPPQPPQRPQPPPQPPQLPRAAEASAANAAGEAVVALGADAEALPANFTTADAATASAITITGAITGAATVAVAASPMPWSEAEVSRTAQDGTSSSGATGSGSGSLDATSAPTSAAAPTTLDGHINYSEYANKLVRDKDLEGALVAFASALEQPDYCEGRLRALVLRNRSFCLLRLGRFKEALSDADEAVAIQPDSSSSRYRQVSRICVYRLTFTASCLPPRLRHIADAPPMHLAPVTPFAASTSHDPSCSSRYMP